MMAMTIPIIAMSQWRLVSWFGVRLVSKAYAVFILLGDYDVNNGQRSCSDDGKVVSRGVGGGQSRVVGGEPSVELAPSNRRSAYCFRDL
jgi:hypothetical protein